MNKILCPDCGCANKKEDILCKECNKELKLNDKYYLLKILGENYGTTYYAIDDKNNYVIIKELSLRTLDKWKIEELFQREIKVLSQLNHNFIPKFIDNFNLGIGRNSRMYLVMEYIEGINLQEEIDSKYYTAEEILNTIKKIANVLDYIHNLNPPLIHRDLKPSNLIRTKNGDIALIDFGSVRDIIKPEGGSTIIGTSGYMPPEQFAGKVTKKSDYYALGVIAVVMFSKKQPENLYNGLDFKWKQHIDVNYDIELFLEKLLAYKEEDRISSSQEIINKINNILASKDKTINKAIIKVISKKKVKKVVKTELEIVLEAEPYIIPKKSESMMKESLINLAKAQKWNIIKELVKSGRDINELGDFNENLLHYAINDNNYLMVKFLIKNKINMNNINKYSQTPLMFALREKKYEIVSLLISENIDFKQKDNQGKNIIMIATETCKIDFFIKIAKKLDNDNLNEKDNKGNTALFYAYNNKNYDIVKYLMNKHIDINQKDAIGETILIKTARNNNIELLKTILKFNPKLEIKDAEHETALFNAIKSHNNEAFKILIEAGADINTQDEFKWTSLMKAVSFEEIEMIKYILKKGGNKSIKNNNGDDVYKIAKYKENLEIIKLLESYE